MTTSDKSEAFFQRSAAIAPANVARQPADQPLPLRGGEPWSDAARAMVDELDSVARRTAIDLLHHCRGIASAKPSAKWLNRSRELIGELGIGRFRAWVLAWFPLVDKLAGEEMLPRVIVDPHADILKGLAWCCSLTEDPEIARTLTAMAISAYKKVPGTGPRAVKVGNACIHALGAMPGFAAVGQLAMLMARVKIGSAQKEIDKALAASAARLGVPREEIEEMAVPAYGLTRVGQRLEKLDEYTAELVVTGTAATELRWLRTDETRQKAIPAAVARDCADDLKDLKAAAKDIQKMLPAQRDRIDQLYLQRRTWPMSVWQERYLNHPLVGTLTRRLVWQFAFDGTMATAIWQDGRLLDSADRPIEPPDSAVVSLWHPLDQPDEQIQSWRGFLERHELTQPLKQAHREVYLLTDAERQTRVYSNRFAAHILKQHQFNALCAVRGWRNKLRLMVDDTYPPAMRLLPAWGLRAEFWIEGIGDTYGTDTNDSGVYLHVSTDQVRFYPIDATENRAHAYAEGYEVSADAQPVPLEQIPPLVLSEVLRDVDLFVGVASLGNDPTWSDRGTQQRIEYWQSYSFGDLSITAATRRDALQRIVPRLKIAARCSFTDKYLVVRGELRTYKIHLGSGNILMEPNDQYLCIVPDHGNIRGTSGRIFLPFEGDNTLSIILSKAFLLAEDSRITDPTILRQIQ